MVIEYYANPAYPAALAIAGNIVKAEFFIDTDPGFGNGTSIAITASTDLNNISFSVPSNALTAGTHRLHFRTLNIEGKWSLSTIQSFTVLQTNITWSGSTSTNWNLASNWVQATIPTSSDTAIIPSTTVTNQPALGNNTTIAKLSVGTGKTLTIASGFTLNNTGDLIINGTITGNGKVELNGVSSQTISGNGSIANLTINNAAGAAVGITTSDTLKVTGVLTPTTGTLTTNNKLVLKSSSVANTAQIGKVGATASINGNAQVERFVPIGRRAYRMLAPGVTTATSIKDNWQEGVNNPNTSTNNNPNPGFGTHITGANSALGFDVTQSGNPSMQLYNPATQTFSFINNSNVLTLNAKSGYPIFIRGNRGIDLNSNSSNSVTTLRATGSLQTGTIIYNNASTPALNTTSEGYSLIGNPYWSLVDWEAVAKSEIASTYFIWDPNINTRGGYTSYTTGGATSGGGAISRYIQPGQAIFMQNTVGASNPVLTFNESNKDSSQVLTATFRTQRQAEIAGKFTVRLYTPALFIEGRVADAATIGFSKDYMAAYNANEDAMPVKGDQTVTVSIVPTVDGRIANNSQSATQHVTAASTQLFDVSKKSTVGIGFNSGTGMMGIKIFGNEFSASSTSGALTVSLEPSSLSGSGWLAGLTCYAPLQFRTTSNGAFSSVGIWENGNNFFSNATIKIDYINGDGVNAPANLRLVNDNGSNWVSIGGVGTSASFGSITSNAVTAFGDIVLANLGIEQTITWNGSTSNNWNTASNWTPATVPVPASLVVIPATGVTNEPSLPTSTSIAVLILETGRVLTINNGTLTITGNLVNKGTINGNGVTELTTSISHAITGTGSIANLTINSNEATIGAGASHREEANWSFELKTVIETKNPKAWLWDFLIGAGHSLQSVPTA
ncbi:unnamed protein product [Rotaria sordida]|uniref:Uncharacterized protein n=1 Tax=Rotaria sordida TaxID=392033 RepID=A0A813WX15_9BILA|nr:unnamed protein product [Rotaria sordida]